MKISVSVRSESRQEKVEKIGDNSYKVWIKEPAIKGKANKSLIRALSSYFKLPKSQIKISFGTKSKKKIIELL